MILLNKHLAVLALTIATILCGCSCVAHEKLAQTVPASASEAETPSVAQGGYFSIELPAIDEVGPSALSDLFKAGFTENPGAEYVVIRINSTGGHVYGGFVMANMIENIRAPVICIVDRYAQSMAAIVLQSCDYRIMTSRSWIMIHKPSYSRSPFAPPPSKKELAGEEEDINAMMHSFMVAVSQRTNGKFTPEEMLQRVNKTGSEQLVVTSETALELGLVDYTVDRIGDADAVITELLETKGLSKYQDR